MAVEWQEKIQGNTAKKTERGGGSEGYHLYQGNLPGDRTGDY